MRYTIALAILLVVQAQASTIAVIDSGTDWRHPAIALNYQMNEGEIEANKTDDDQNGFIDDRLGWNFAEQNNEVIDYSYLGKFSPDVKQFFVVQTRMLEGTATTADKEWLKNKKDDQEFLKELQTFGNFAHGTHVGAITAKGHADNMLFAVKLIPTEVKMPGQAIFNRSQIFSSAVPMSAGFKDLLFASGLAALAKQQAKMLATVGAYVKVRQADVANGSFGTGFAQAKMIVEALYKMVFKEEEQSEEHMMGFVKGFMASLVMESKAFVDAAPKTLFVFAAGNDGSNNDETPCSPANIRADNSITVAATMHNKTLAVFSNFGENMVDVAAPGVGILSAIPGTDMMPMSGTSQAAPYVSNVAAAVKSANMKLRPIDVKQILMGTVDKKAWLQGKVGSSGLVNPARAILAAELSAQTDLYSAIAEARKTVKDMDTGTSIMNVFDGADAEEAFVAPLPSPMF